MNILHIYGYTCVCLCVCACVRVRVYVRGLRAYMYTWVRAIRACMHAYTRSCLSFAMYICTCILWAYHFPRRLIDCQVNVLCIPLKSRECSAPTTSLGRELIYRKGFALVRCAIFVSRFFPVVNHSTNELLMFVAKGKRKDFKIFRYKFDDTFYQRDSFMHNQA